MAVSGTVPARSRRRFDPTRSARGVRRATWVAALLVFTWFLLKFGTRWVPADMNTVPDVPPGSWCIVDRWCGGLRIGSDVFVETPVGPLLSRVVALAADTVRIEHPHPTPGWPDSRQFGPLPRRNVQSTVMVVFRPESARGQ